MLSGLSDMDLSMLVDETYRLPMRNSVTIPQSVDHAAVRSALLKEDKIEIGLGLGPPWQEKYGESGSWGIRPDRRMWNV